MTMSIYAVTGASGHPGRYAVQQLLARGVPASDIVAVVRTRGNAAGLAAVGVQVREADYSRPETLGAALADTDRLLLVSSSQVGQLVAQHRRNRRVVHRSTDIASVRSPLHMTLFPQVVREKDFGHRQLGRAAVSG